MVYMHDLYHATVKRRKLTQIYFGYNIYYADKLVYLRYSKYQKFGHILFLELISYMRSVQNEIIMSFPSCHCLA